MREGREGRHDLRHGDWFKPPRISGVLYSAFNILSDVLYSLYLYRVAQNVVTFNSVLIIYSVVLVN